MTINKQIKNAIDNLEVWDELVCKYKVESIWEDGLYELSEIEWFKLSYMWYDEIFDLLYDGIKNLKSNKKI